MNRMLVNRVGHEFDRSHRTVTLVVQYKDCEFLLKDLSFVSRV